MVVAVAAYFLVVPSIRPSDLAGFHFEMMPWMRVIPSEVGGVESFNVSEMKRFAPLSQLIEQVEPFSLLGIPGAAIEMREVQQYELLRYPSNGVWTTKYIVIDPEQDAYDRVKAAVEGSESVTMVTYRGHTIYMNATDPEQCATFTEGLLIDTTFGVDDLESLLDAADGRGSRLFDSENARKAYFLAMRDANAIKLKIDTEGLYPKFFDLELSSLSMGDTRVGITVVYAYASRADADEKMNVIKAYEPKHARYVDVEMERFEYDLVENFVVVRSHCPMDQLATILVNW